MAFLGFSKENRERIGLFMREGWSNNVDTLPNGCDNVHVKSSLIRKIASVPKSSNINSINVKISHLFSTLWPLCAPKFILFEGAISVLSMTLFYVNRVKIFLTGAALFWPFSGRTSRLSALAVSSFKIKSDFCGFGAAVRRRFGIIGVFTGA